MPDSAPGHLYEADEHAWIAARIDAPRGGDPGAPDRAHLIELLTDMTIRDRRDRASRLTVLPHHPLKARVQPEKPSRRRVTTIMAQQRDIRGIVTGIPSLGRQADVIATAADPDAVRAAARDTGLPAARFPATPPWTVAEALAFDPPEPGGAWRAHPMSGGGLPRQAARC